MKTIKNWATIAVGCVWMLPYTSAVGNEGTSAFSTTKASSTIKQFDAHGFAIKLESDWSVTQAAGFYDRYIELNRRALGEDTGQALKKQTGLVFKAERAGNSAVFLTCFSMDVAANLASPHSDKKALMYKGANNSYTRYVNAKFHVLEALSEGETNAVPAYGFEVQHPNDNGFIRMKLFIAQNNFVVCSGASGSEQRAEIKMMLDSINLL